MAAPRGYSQAQLPNFTPEQMQLFQSLLGNIGGGAGQGLGFLSKLAGGDEATFNQIEQPAYNAFNAQLGNIGSRFSHVGGRDSSAFQNAILGQGSEFAQDLASKRAGLQSSAIESLLGQSNKLLGQSPFQNFLAPKGGGSGGAILSALGQLLPSLLESIPGLAGLLRGK